MATPSSDDEANQVFFNKTPAPIELPEIQNQLIKFIEFHNTHQNKIVLVTSGGTTVPLEKNTVRFLDNFSAGTRGAASAEYFLQNGYAVIFLHRRFSREPFSRHFSHNTNCFLNYFQINAQTHAIEAIPNHAAELERHLKSYQKVMSDNLFLKLDFLTVDNYLHILRVACKALNSCQRRALIYLAAAVSDFYVPFNEMVEHKIQSCEGGLTLHLPQVPKMLKVVTNDWCPNAFIVSFKLETDPSILERKARESLENYGHKLVVANDLNTRSYKVTLVSPESKLELIKDENDGKEIEVDLVKQISERHSAWINEKKR